MQGVFVCLALALPSTLRHNHPGITWLVSQLGFPGEGNVNSKPRLLQRQACGYIFSREVIFSSNPEPRLRSFLVIFLCKKADLFLIQLLMNVSSLQVPALCGDLYPNASPYPGLMPCLCPHAPVESWLSRPTKGPSVATGSVLLTSPVLRSLFMCVPWMVLMCSNSFMHLKGVCYILLSSCRCFVGEVISEISSTKFPE